MKKITTMAYVAALALVSTAGLTSCKSDEPGNGNYNGETVKTEFAINLPNEVTGGNTGINRMPSATVQRDGASQFQGITGITLVPFAKNTAITSSDTRLGNNIVLTGNVEATDVNKPSHAKVYTDVSIPLATSSFLFYGKSAAIGGGNELSNQEKKFRVGSLIAANLDNNHNPSDFAFQLEQIENAPASIMASAEKGGKLLQYLTNVAAATDGASNAWSASTNAVYAAMYTTFIQMKGLSSFEVERVLTDLYQSLKPLREAGNLADGIMKAIEDDADLYADVNASDEVVLKTGLKDFPASYYLPEGSVNIKWSGSAFVSGDYAGMATLDRYVYPAQLWYYVNSTIKTSNTSKQTMYDNTNDWAVVLGAHNDGTTVSTVTRAVAIKDAIQYAVARLDVQVSLKTSTMEDNSASVVGSRTDVNVSAGFPISAILVGGQQEVKFDFTANTAATEYTIYDNVMTSTQEETPDYMVAQVKPTYSAMNHTLVLENGTGIVNVAIEMTNTTGADFYGVGGQLIPKNGKFYVVAQLDPSTFTGESDKTNGHVFKQDFITTAKLTLKDLKSAYNTIPDLRTPKLELGFSVDLTWQNGNIYDIEF